MIRRPWQAAVSLWMIAALLSGVFFSLPEKATTVSGAQAQPRVDAELLAQLQSPGQVSYWILFRQAPDLSQAANFTDWSARGQYVLDRLRESARTAQARVAATLDLMGVSYTSYWINNSILVEGSSTLTLNALLGFSEIESLQARKKFALVEPLAVNPADESAKAVEANITHINADDAWALGISGAGIVVANIDTGVRYTHQALVSHYRGNLGGGSFDHNYNWFDPYGDYPAAPADGHGHGSHTMGIIVGSDGGSNQTGVAPGAQWIACRGCNTNDCTDAALLACAQFMVAPTNLGGGSPDASLRPHVVNNSWGDCATSYDNWFQGAVDAWLAAGIYPVFSVGNAGNCGYAVPPGLNTVGNPGRYGNVSGVGSSGTFNGLYATHSNWGPTDNLDMINPRSGFAEMKPQVLAPGVNIRSSYRGSDSQYVYMNGTSMSAPHLAGLVALIWQAAPCLARDYATTESLIEATAEQIT
jgi:subtilisin family serine protease